MLLLAACVAEPGAIELAPLADGQWSVLAVGEDGAIAARGQTSDPAFALLSDTLEPIPLDTFTVDGILLARARDHYLAPTGQPQLRAAPADPTRYAFEHDYAIYVFQATDSTLHKLTLDEDVDSLRAKQSEGEVILYWSVNPVWSGDGRFISFLSNRESVRANGPNSQSVWVIDAGTGAQKQLLFNDTVSYHVDGVLGEEFLLSSSGAPGVHAVHPRTGTLRKLHDGYVLASHAGGGGALISDDQALVLIRGETRDTLSPLPNGWSWGSARFSPNGERIALFATDGAGSYVLHVVLRDGTDLNIALPGPPTSGPDWISNDDVVFAAAPRGQPIRTYRARLK